MTEKRIETDILTYLNGSKLGFYFKVNTTGTYDPVRKVFRTIKNKFIIKGTADIIGCDSNGRFVALEVKTPARRKTATEEQLRFLKCVSESGGLSGVVCSVEEAVSVVMNDSIAQ
jgi:hypothetical protein